MGRYFGTDGFRGEANVKLTAVHAYKIGRFLGWHFGKEKKAKIVIGKDTRLSGDMLEYALTAGLTASGADVYLLKVTTTPSVSYLTKTQGFDCGIMISASHNPFYDNGIKLINAKGEKIEAEVENAIEDYIDAAEDELPIAGKEEIGRAVDYTEGRELYIDHLISALKCSVAGLKIGLDCANGSASSIAGPLFEKLGADVKIIHAEPNGININAGCGSTHIEALQAFVKENGLDVGFAFDGDADRCFAVDEEGNAVDGDGIMYVCGKYLMENGRLNKNTIVTTIMSNIGLFKAFDREKISSVKTDVGDKYVSAAMVKDDFSLGGEQSGHIIFREYASTGDGILTALMTLEAMVMKKASLGTLYSEVQVFPQLLKNVRVKDKQETMTNEKVLQAVAEVEKKLGEDGRILVRKSGTEPVIRVMVEAESDAICAENVEYVLNVIKEEGLEA